MFDWITSIVQQMGSPGIALLMFLENVFPPIPSELVMPLAGFVAERGQFPLWGAIVAGSIGSLAGAIGWYVLGRRVGERRLRRWVDRHGRWLTLSCADIDRSKSWFERHGGTAVFIGRLIPGVRTFISVPAGFARMAPVPFVLYSALGTVLWTALLAFAGKLLGANYERVGQYLDPVTWVVLGAFVVAYVVRLVRWRTSGDEDCDEDRDGGRDGGRNERGQGERPARARD